MDSSLPVSEQDPFVGDSEMALMMRQHDWAQTPLGPPNDWPQGLKVALRLLLTSKFEMWLGWGPDIMFFYNDAYRPTLGNKHPHALGMATQVLWAEIWDDIKDRLSTVYETGQGTLLYGSQSNHCQWINSFAYCQSFFLPKRIL